MRMHLLALMSVSACSSSTSEIAPPPVEVDSSSAFDSAIAPLDTSTTIDTAGPVDTGSIPFDGAKIARPSDLLDLKNWKLTLPIGSAGAPTEIEQPTLESYANFPWFYVDTARAGVVFRAHCGGVTTSGSKYPRSELREMTDMGKTRAAWSTTAGKHTMIVKEAVFTLPGTLKPQVVTAQIHDDADDVVMVRAEKDPKTGVIQLRASYPKSDGTNGNIPLLASYTLGTYFVVEITAEKGNVDVSLDGVKKGSFARSTNGCYFKAGCYTQSNVKDVGEDKDAYGEVAIQSIEIVHK